MTEVPARLSIVTLGVQNMGVLRSFYRALGWRELPSVRTPLGAAAGRNPAYQPVSFTDPLTGIAAPGKERSPGHRSADP